MVFNTSFAINAQKAARYVLQKQMSQGTRRPAVCKQNQAVSPTLTL